MNIRDTIKTWVFYLCLLGMIAALAVSTARADPAEFCEGKTLELLIG